MELLIQIGIVFLFCFFGEIVESMLPFAFPASVIAMVLLFLALKFRVVKPSQINQKADFLLKNMSFFFIPAGVEIMNYFSLLGTVLIPFLLICIISTILTFLSATYTVRLVQSVMDRWRKTKILDELNQ